MPSYSSLHMINTPLFSSAQDYAPTWAQDYAPTWAQDYAPTELIAK